MLSFSRAQSFKLLAFLVLAYIGTAALGLALTRLLPGVSVALIVFPVVVLTLIISLSIQRLVVNEGLEQPFRAERWWLTLVMGIVLSLFTLGVVASALLVLTLPGAPLADWFASRASADANELVRALRSEPMTTANWSAYLVAVGVVWGASLLSFWPLGNRLSQRTGRASLPFITMNCVQVIGLGAIAFVASNPAASAQVAKAVDGLVGTAALPIAGDIAVSIAVVTGAFVFALVIGCGLAAALSAMSSRQRAANSPQADASTVSQASQAPASGKPTSDPSLA